LHILHIYFSKSLGMKRRRMSTEYEMDHSYAMPNVVSYLHILKKKKKVYILIMFRMTILMLFWKKSKMCMSTDY
jgi:hypothetical protein